MINFLPPEAKSAVKREYIVRIVSIWAILLAVVAFAGAVLLLPTYVLLARQFEALQSEVVETENDATMQAYETAHTALEKMHTLARQLGTASAGPTASELLAEIQRAQSIGISLSDFLYEHNGTKVQKVAIGGTATTREALVEFSAALERNPLFLRAQVPVSNLAAARDLPFTLIIVLAENRR